LFNTNILIGKNHLRQEVSGMRNILTLIVVLIIAATPVLANVYQKADLSGGNAVDIKVDQTAWNHGNGNIYQNIGVKVTGNVQVMDQDNIVMVSDDDHSGDVNTSIAGLNIIRINMNQFAKNEGSGDLGQSADILVTDNRQELDQEILLMIG
jgi:hypothetical protein